MSSHINSVMVGDYNNTKKPVKINSSGDLMVQLKANDGSSVQDLSCDTSGRLQVNVLGEDEFNVKRPVLVDTSGKLQVNTTQPAKASSSITNDSTGTVLSGSLSYGNTTESVSLGNSTKMMVFIGGVSSSDSLNLEVSHDGTTFHPTSVYFYPQTNDNTNYSMVGSADNLICHSFRFNNVDTVNSMSFSSFDVTVQ